MKVNMGSVLMAGLLSAVGTNAWAALPQPSPGQWLIQPEVRMNGRDVTGMMGVLQEQLISNLPAKQRDRLPPAARQPLEEPKQVCVSPKQAKMLADPEGALKVWGKELAGQGCTITKHAVSGNKVTFEGQCSQDAKVFQGDVTGELLYHSNRHLSGKVSGTGAPVGGVAGGLQGALQAAGQSLRTELLADMQWQGANCAIGRSPVD